MFEGGNPPNSGEYEGELAVPGLAHLLLLLHLGKPLPLPVDGDPRQGSDGDDDNKDDGGGLVLRCFPLTFSPRLRPCSSFSPPLPSPPPPPPRPPRQPQRLVLEYLLATPRRAPDHVRAILSFVQDIKLQCLQCSF